MTNTLTAIVVSTVVTNWVPFNGQEIGVLVEKRTVTVAGETLNLKDQIIGQAYVREALLLTNQQNQVFVIPGNHLQKFFIQ